MIEEKQNILLLNRSEAKRRVRQIANRDVNLSRCLFGNRPKHFIRTSRYGFSAQDSRFLARDRQLRCASHSGSGA
jgi:hypothetical protein